MLCALIAALLFTGYFAFRAANGVLYWKIEGQTQVRGWMTVPYVARRNRVPISVLNQALGLAADAEDKRPLARIARSQNVPLEELESKLNSAILAHRGSEPDPQEETP